MLHVRYILSLAAERVCLQKSIYSYAPHNDVSVNDGQHRDGGPIRLQYYNIL